MTFLEKTDAYLKKLKTLQAWLRGGGGGSYGKDSMLLHLSRTGIEELRPTRELRDACELAKVLGAGISVEETLPGTFLATANDGKLAAVSSFYDAPEGAVSDVIVELLRKRIVQARKEHRKGTLKVSSRAHRV